jgi:8-oxo-dGTP diphosphatase
MYICIKVNLNQYKQTITKKHKPRTVVFLVEGNKVLLGYKKNGFGKGYYVGIGGKVEKAESIKKSAMREVQEEIGVIINTEDLEAIATLDFYFPTKTDQSWDQQVHGFLVTKWKGKPIETEEIKPVWFDKNQLPLTEMWDDARYWIPSVISNIRIRGEFLFDKNLKVIEHKMNTDLKVNDLDYLKQAYEFAAKSSADPSTQAGALLVNAAGKIVSWGTNRLPIGVLELPERFIRPTKYAFFTHAESAAIVDAARRGIQTEGLVMYAPWSACSDCAKVIIDAGVKRVVAHQKIMDGSYNQWPESIRIAKEMFQEAGVNYELIDGDIGEVEILFNGQKFKP